MKILILTLILSLFQLSCNETSHNEVIIYPNVIKKDSLLILNIKNNTNSNIMIGFPMLEDFFYEDEFKASTPEVMFTKTSFETVINKEDSIIYRNINCKTFMSLMNISNMKTPKFIKSKSEKKYYLKIKRYRKGKTILFIDDGIKIFEVSDKNKKSDFEMIKIKDCSGYKYFTGNFSFYPEKIVLK